MGERIAVIGAGLAGLSAARRLRDAGCDVVVFDKGRHPGGRLATRRSDGLSFDHGAQYFTCRDEIFVARVGDWCARGLAARWDEPIASLESGERRPARGADARFVGVPGMSALARDLASGIRVVCEYPIAQLERAHGGWRLRATGGGAWDSFGTVLIATPAPQALPLLASSPGLSERVASVGMEPCHAALVAFDEPLAVDFGGAFVSKSPLAWVARENAKPGRGGRERWVLHTIPEWSRLHLEEDSNVVCAMLLAAFRAGARPQPAAGPPPRRAPLALRPHHAPAGAVLDEKPGPPG